MLIYHSKITKTLVTSSIMQSNQNEAWIQVSNSCQPRYYNFFMFTISRIQRLTDECIYKVTMYKSIVTFFFFFFF